MVRTIDLPPLAKVIYAALILALFLGLVVVNVWVMVRDRSERTVASALWTVFWAALSIVVVVGLVDAVGELAA